MKVKAMAGQNIERMASSCKFGGLFRQTMLLSTGQFPMTTFRTVSSGQIPLTSMLNATRCKTSKFLFGKEGSAKFGSHFTCI